MEKVRVSMHNGRSGSAKHNDRSFLDNKTEQEQSDIAPHINLELTKKNLIWCWLPDSSFTEAELIFYKKNYTDSINAINERNTKQGHSERNKTVEDVFHGPKTRPEEQILQIGNMYDQITPEVFIKCVNEYINFLQEWNDSHGNHMHLLNVAIHLDETSPHAHIRRVWDYVDDDGNRRLGQNKALEAAGINLPKPEQKVGRYNNRKITFDEMTRNFWQQICINHGFEIETEPKPGIKHKDKEDYISNQIEKEIAEKQSKKEELENEIQFLEMQKESLVTEDEFEIINQNVEVKSNNTVLIDKNDYEILLKNAKLAIKLAQQVKKLQKNFQNLYNSIKLYQKLEMKFPEEFKKMRRSLLRIRRNSRDDR